VSLPELLRRMKPGAPSDFPPGSVDRAKALSGLVHAAWSLVSTTERTWQRELERARREDVPRLLGFADFDSYLVALIGKTEDQARDTVRQRGQQLAADDEVKRLNTRREAGAKGGRGKKAVDNINSFRGGTGASYLVRRLKRDAPDIAAALARGEYRSARAAAIAAGIVKVPTPMERAKKAALSLSPSDRKRLAQWLADQD
jgi:hypothetical protein